MKKILFAVLCYAVLWVCCNFFETQKNDSVTNEPEITAVPDFFKTANPTKTPTPKPTPTPTAKQRKQMEEEFKDSCLEYTDNIYELLMRESIKSGTRLCLEVEVVQDMAGITTDYYRTKGTIDIWDEEYIIYDCREKDKPKIIEGDIIKIYGEFSKLGKFERSLTWTTVEIPVIYAKYIEFPELENQNENH